MAKPEVIGLIAILLLFLVTLPFLIANPPSGSGGSSSDSNQVAVSAADTTPNYLFPKLSAGSGITLAIQNPGGNENILISATGGGGSGTGRTYTSGTPATIQVDNDLNRISQNYDGNFWSRANPLFPVPDVNLLDLSWTKLKNYPVACASGEFVNTIDDIPICFNPADFSGNGDIVSTVGPITIVNGLNRLFGIDTLTLDLPQNIETTSGVTFDSVTATSLIRTRDLNATGDANLVNITFKGTLSGGDFNYSLRDANSTVDCGAGFTLQAVGATTTCVAVGSGSGTDSNKLMVTGQDTNAGFLRDKLLSGAFTSLTLVNPGASEQLRINSSTCDNNTSCTFPGYYKISDNNFVDTNGDYMTGALLIKDRNNPFTVKNQFTDANVYQIDGNGNTRQDGNATLNGIFARNGASVLLDGNFLPVDVNTNFGLGGNPFGQARFVGYRALPPAGTFDVAGSASMFPVNTWFACVFQVAGSQCSQNGEYFNGGSIAGTQAGIDTFIGGNLVFKRYGGASSAGAILISPRTTDPTETGGLSSGALYVKDNQTFDGNILLINVGSTSSPNWIRVGARQVDMNITGDINHSGFYSQDKTFVIQKDVNTFIQDSNIGSAISIGTADLTGLININIQSKDGNLYVPNVASTIVSFNALVRNGTTGQVFAAVSSQKYKENIQDLNRVFDISLIQQLRPVTYTAIGDPSQRGYGFIAEEVNQFLPQFVEVDDKGSINSLQYQSLFVTAIAELQRVYQEVLTIKDQVATNQTDVSNAQQDLLIEKQTNANQQSEIDNQKLRIAALEFQNQQIIASLCAIAPQSNVCLPAGAGT